MDNDAHPINITVTAEHTVEVSETLALHYRPDDTYITIQDTEDLWNGYLAVSLNVSEVDALIEALQNVRQAIEIGTAVETIG